MDFIEVFIREVITIIGYALLFVSAYKLYQISNDLREIKETLKGRVQAAPPPISAASSSLADLHASDDASAYAENLLRAVNAESRAPVPAVPPATSEPR
ncbi:MAG TPA: hypothetical protein VGR73_02295 [Bryobacteraceae bacterium]|nr:hypothetical protein [Bryobacteraceae bacterium]